jgi:hypothetical protein
MVYGQLDLVNGEDFHGLDYHGLSAEAGVSPLKASCSLVCFIQGIAPGSSSNSGIHILIQDKQDIPAYRPKR